MPVIGGGRLTGKAGPWSIGALNMETDDDAAADARADQLHGAARCGATSCGAAPSAASSRAGRSRPSRRAPTTCGASTATSPSTRTSTSAATSRKSRTEGRERRRPQLPRAVQLHRRPVRPRSSIGSSSQQNFNPEVGFLRRENFRRNFAQARFSPRPAQQHDRPQVHLSRAASTTSTDNDNHLESREAARRVPDRVAEQRRASRRVLRATTSSCRQPFQIADGVAHPGRRLRLRQRARSPTAAGPAASRCRAPPPSRSAASTTGPRRPRRSTARVDVTPQLGVEPNISLNWIDLPQGASRRPVIGGADDVHDDAADVRRRARPVQLEQPRRSRPTCGSAGSISRAASCSSSTPKAATRCRRRAAPRSRTAGSSSRSIGCCDSESRDRVGLPRLRARELWRA